MSDISMLEQSAYRIRRYALRMGEVQGQGYIGQALGWADVLAASTLYSSCEPCAMCAGAIFWSGIGRLVYALAGSTLNRISGDGPALEHPARVVLADGTRVVEVSGPHLEDEAAVAHREFWV